MSLPILVHYRINLHGEEPDGWSLSPLTQEENRPVIHFRLGEGKEGIHCWYGRHSVVWYASSKPKIDDCIRIIVASARCREELVRVHLYDPTNPHKRIPFLP